MLAELRDKLQAEVERLNHEINFVLPKEIEKARAHGDLRENSEYKAALERQQFAQARASHLRLRLSKLSSVKEDDITCASPAGISSAMTMERSWSMGMIAAVLIPLSVMNHSWYAWSGSFGASPSQRTSQRWCAPSAKMVTAPSRPPVDTGTCTSRVAVP